jgi:hypothetical protein
MLDDIFFTVVFLESLASQGFEKKISQNALLVARPTVMIYHSGPLGGVGSRYWQRLPLVARCRWQAPWGALLTRLAVSPTKVEEDVDGGPLGGRCWWVRQHPPPRL